MAAIDKMESSVGRDVEELNFQNGKVNTSFGQLEAQIRQAKVAMIEERVRSKKEKLTEMYATKTELDRKMEQLQEKEKRKADEASTERTLASVSGLIGRVGQPSGCAKQHRSMVRVGSHTAQGAAGHASSQAKVEIFWVHQAAKACAAAAEETAQEASGVWTVMVKRLRQQRVGAVPEKCRR